MHIITHTERTHEIFVRPSGVDNLKASGGQEAGQHEDEQRETDDDRDVTPQAVPVPIVRRDLHDDCAAHAPSHEHLAGCNHPYLDGHCPFIFIFSESVRRAARREDTKKKKRERAEKAHKGEKKRKKLSLKREEQRTKKCDSITVSVFL